MKLNCFLTSIFLFVMISLQAQVTGVKYLMKFNTQTKNYDIYLKIEKGSAYLSKHRIQFNSQISVIVPNNSVVSVEENFMPLQNNADYKGTKACKWNVTNFISNATSLNGNSVYGIVPSLNPTPFYNDLNAGDIIKLFSLKVSPVPTCGEDVRFFDNERDPMSSSRDLHGADFSNGFTIGSTAQVYAGNEEIENQFLPKGDLLSSLISVNENEDLKLYAGNWENAASYAWTGPNGFTSNQKNVIVNGVNKSNEGIYTLTITSEQGCKISKELRVEVKESIISDVVDTYFGYETSIFPNPATDYINVTVKANSGSLVNASIYDITGKVVMKNVINQKLEGSQIEKSIPIKFNPGIYTLKVKVNNKESEHKFICVE